MLGIIFLLGLNSATLASSYTVKPYDSLFAIGQKFGMTIKELQVANNLEGTNIYPGQVLSIPFYTVRSGDNLFLIGQKFGLTIEQLQAANNLRGDLIHPGQILNIPCKNSYTVKSGDTLYLIARNRGITWQELMSHNNLQSANIFPGQTLIMPASSSIERFAATTYSDSFANHNFTREELTLLARTVYSEARGESYEGQVAVAAVVLNRLNHPDFPDTVECVIFQPLAFEPVANGQFWLTPNQTAYDAVFDAINGWDPVDGALYFWNPVTATSTWIWTRSITHQIGRHVFGI